MKDYQFFEFDDFLEDVAFRRWVFNPLPQDDIYWEQWQTDHPAQKATIQQARQQLLTIKGNLLLLSDEHIDQKVAQLVQRAQAMPGNEEPTAPIVRRISATWYYMAASVALLLGLLWLYQTQLNPESSTPNSYAHLLESATQPLVEVENSGSQPKKVTLSDGSTIVLYKNSRLSYPKQFNTQTREVYLTGEAFFQIHKNPGKPFLVYANELVTKVLGTSFFVKAYEKDQNVSVTVRTGKVSVFAQADKDAGIQKTSRELGGMILMPNQQATWMRVDKRLVRSLIAQPLRVDNQILTTAFVFKQTPIADVFAALERAYGVDIVFDEALMANCTLTARLDDESLYKKLEWICAGTESSYEVVDGQIIITSQGCQ
ncbi:FecR family protein [Spirosoma sp. RP8]|uniref:FecR family protein n=1 Tax=Spirosoma liriopis TaxID=2937440 RepID=A0ABT0HUS3_9BACT|nr:FecR family protein [Spirosoma liriopis]MCK8495949.1 FecR family protein [Spirosoma liriopis]